MTRLLLVSTAFHGYWRSIAAALERRGYEVVPHLYDDYASTRAKVRNKVRYELPERLGRDGRLRMAQDIGQALRGRLLDVRPDITLVVKGDVFTTETWDDIGRLSGCHALWLYDEVRRTRYDDARLQMAGRIATYSRQDWLAMAAPGRQVIHLPNAFDPAHLPVTGSALPLVSFVGARYPNRQQALEHLHDAGVPVRAFGREWSHHPFDRLRTWSLSRPSLPAARDVPLSSAYELMHCSAATLNPHFDQDGFTMRTFEAPGVGGLQLIDRADVDEFYEPGSEVAVYGDLDELTDLARRALVDTSWAQGIREAGQRRTLAEHTFDHRMAVLEQLWA